MNSQHEYYGRNDGVPFVSNRKDWTVGLAYVIERSPSGAAGFLYENGEREAAPIYDKPYDFGVWKRLTGAELPKWCVPPNVGAPATYRLLQPGEVVRKGDELSAQSNRGDRPMNEFLQLPLETSGWIGADALVGDVVKPTYCLWVRRRIVAPDSVEATLTLAQ